MDDYIIIPEEEYHIASGNSRFVKQTRQAYALNYDPRIVELVRKAPLQLESTGAQISLPIDAQATSMPLWQAITQRRSARGFTGKRIALEELGTLLYLANGVRADRETGSGMIYQRNVPSAGNLGSVEVYCLIINVESIEPGIYHFDSVKHELTCLTSADYSTWVRECALLQAEFADAAALLILTSAVSRLAEKYGLRAYRLALLDAGHVSQNIYLVATALGLQVCATAGFVDCDLNSALQLDGLDRCAQLVVGVSGK